MPGPVGVAEVNKEQVGPQAFDQANGPLGDPKGIAVDLLDGIHRAGLGQMAELLLGKDHGRSERRRSVGALGNL
jgi:hypothetical protein